MDTTTLGRTGLEVSVAGLGCGGHSRLGMARGGSERDAQRVVEAAVGLGINFIDTARAYGTEEVVGRAVRGRRDEVVLSTKVSPVSRGELLGAEAIEASLEKSLRRLDTDYVDVFHLHGVTADQYADCLQQQVPVLERQRELGKIRFIGVTEHFTADTRHQMLRRALADDRFDVVMVGHNLLNPCARHTVFPLTLENKVGTLLMFAVRRALSQPEALADLVSDLVESGELSDVADPARALDFVTEHPEVSSLVQAAYRYGRHEPGVDVVLTGTGSVAHLEENVASILAPPLPAQVTQRLEQMFGAIDSVSGN